MKTKSLIAIVIFALATSLSCESDSGKKKNKKENKKTELKEQPLLKPEELVYDKAGKYLERYPDGKTKIEGQKNEAGERQGHWVAYSNDGTKQSEITYSKGKKHGIHIVYFPNGNPTYVGEWNMDKKIGEWKFYNQAGTLVKTENFDK